jgi:hypothetical protein
LTPGRFALAAVLIAAFLVVVALAEDGGDRAPRDEAIALVPADALLYAHLAIDRDSQGWKDAEQTLSRFPRLVWRVTVYFVRWRVAAASSTSTPRSSHG